MPIVHQYFRDYEIPSSMRHLWKYLRNAYEAPAFSETLPTDDDLCKFHWTRLPDNILSEFRKKGIKGEALTVFTCSGMNISQ